MPNGSLRKAIKVTEGDVVLVIDTEKVAHEIEATSSGLIIILADVGEELACGTVVGIIAASQEEFETLSKERPQKRVVDEDQLEGSGKTQADKGVQETAAPKTKSTGRVFISPAAKKLAQKHNYDYSTITGSGAQRKNYKG